MPKENQFHCVGILAVLILGAGQPLNAHAKKPPNILLLIADDCTRFDLGC